MDMSASKAREARSIEVISRDASSVFPSAGGAGLDVEVAVSEAENADALSAKYTRRKSARTELHMRSLFRQESALPSCNPELVEE